MEALSKVSLDNYRSLLPTIGGMRVIYNTVILVLCVSLFVLFFSFMVSWVVVRSRVRGRQFMDTIAMLPHAIPGLGFAFALFIIAIPLSRWIPWLALNGTLIIIVVAHVLNRLAYGTRITNAALLQIHQELEESAKICGARNFATWFWVIVPLIRPSLRICRVMDCPALLPGGDHGTVSNWAEEYGAFCCDVVPMAGGRFNNSGGDGGGDGGDYGGFVVSHVMVYRGENAGNSWATGGL